MAHYFRYNRVGVERHPVRRGISVTCRGGMVLLYDIYVILATLRNAVLADFFTGRRVALVLIIGALVFATMLFTFAMLQDMWRATTAPGVRGADEVYFTVVSIVFFVIAHAFAIVLNFS